LNLYVQIQTFSELRKLSIYDPLRPNAFDLSLRHSIAVEHSILGNIIPQSVRLNGTSI